MRLIQLVIVRWTDILACSYLGFELFLLATRRGKEEANSADRGTIYALWALIAGGCEDVETPTVPVNPDPRLIEAMRMPDDPTPSVVEIKVPVPSPQLRPDQLPLQPKRPQRTLHHRHNPPQLQRKKLRRQ